MPITTSTLLRVSLGAGLLCAACGDDAETTQTDGGTGTATTAGPTGDPTTNPTVDNTETTVEPTTVGMSASMGTTDINSTTVDNTETTVDASTGTTEPIEPPDTTTTTGDTTTTTGDDTTTTTGDDTTTTTTTETTDETADPSGDPDECALAQMHSPCDADSDDALHAMGLNCTSLGGNYNDTNAVPVENLSFQAPPPIAGERSWQVARSYGTYIDPMSNKPLWGAREGDKMLMISSGLIPPADAQGVITIEDGMVYGDTFFSFNNQAPWDNNVIPPPMATPHGSPDPMGFSNCDGVNDCSNTLQEQWMMGGSNPEDKMWFSFDVTAPAIANGDIADANGFTFEFAYFSAEFPEYVGSGFNDIFVAWQASEAYTGNITFINEQPLTVTALWPVDYDSGCAAMDFGCIGNQPELEGTGFMSDGAATSWYKAISGVNPGETFTLAFAVFDMGDSSHDTAVLLDNWQWDCEGCVPTEVMGCGIMPQ